MERKYWRVAEVAEALALSRAKVALMIQRGELPAARFGRSVRVEAHALEAFIRDRSGDPRSDAHATWADETEVDA